MEKASNKFNEQATAIIDKHFRLLQEELTKSFCEHFPHKDHCSQVFESLWENWNLEEIPDLGEKVISIFNGECPKEELNLWDYDLLEHIIEISNTYGLKIPKEIVNGLPEQLVLLVKHKLMQIGRAHV